MMINLRNQKIDLSHISNLEDIDHEIKIIKRRIKSREAEIKNDFKDVPKEAVKASLGSITPFFKKAKAADSLFSTVQTLIGGIVAAIIEGKRSGGGFKKGLATTLRQLSFLGTAKAIINFFGHKKERTTAGNAAVKPTVK